MRYLTSLLALVLVGCGSVPAKVEKMVPPVELLADCPIQEPTFRTNRELAEYAQGLKYALESCNHDKSALREWAGVEF